MMKYNENNGQIVIVKWIEMTMKIMIIIFNEIWKIMMDNNRKEKKDNIKKWNWREWLKILMKKIFYSDGWTLMKEED